uniref:KRAB domain-containing protein n=1 Tax=Junco hyemalis TaxID=40217 RepID=A0A8C5J9M4_JUNHY
PGPPSPPPGRAEWDALTAEQRELYRDVLSDTYELLTSLGNPGNLLGLSVELGGCGTSHTSIRALRNKSLSGSSFGFSLAFPTSQRCFHAR